MSRRGKTDDRSVLRARQTAKAGVRAVLRRPGLYLLINKVTLDHRPVQTDKVRRISLLNLTGARRACACSCSATPPSFVVATRWRPTTARQPVDEAAMAWENKDLSEAIF